MKLPSKSKIIQIIKDGQWVRKYTSSSGYEEGILLNTYTLPVIADNIIKLIKQEQFEEDSKEAAPEVDPNLIKIAELEAKLAVYQAVCNGAGIRLAMPDTKKEEFGVTAPDKKEVEK